jgi:hypothetical protein
LLDGIAGGLHAGGQVRLRVEYEAEGANHNLTNDYMTFTQKACESTRDARLGPKESATKQNLEND